jgi:hypothetical protein
MNVPALLIAAAAVALLSGVGASAQEGAKSPTQCTGSAAECKENEANPQGTDRNPAPDREDPDGAANTRGVGASNGGNGPNSAGGAGPADGAGGGAQGGSDGN